MTTLLTFRLALWRELRARWFTLLLLPLHYAFGVMLSENVAGAWDLYVVYLLAPAMVGLLAARGPGRADAFWIGLGGPATARSLGALCAHALVLVPTLLAFYWRMISNGAAEVIGEGMPALPPIGGLSPLTTVTSAIPYAIWLSAIYAVIFAARGVCAGAVVLVGPLVGFGAGVVMGASWWWFGDISLSTVALVGGGALTLGGLALGLRWSTRLGAWGASVSGRTAREVGAPVGGLVAGSAVLIAAWPALPAGEMEVSVAPDGTSAVFYQDAMSDIDWRGLAWQWREEEGYRRIDRQWVQSASAGPGGAVAAVHSSSALGGRWGVGGFTVVLEAADGREARCEVSKWPSLEQWRPDGDAVAFTAGEAAWVLEADGRCNPVTASASSVAWSGDHLMTLASREGADGLRRAQLTRDGEPVSLPAARSFGLAQIGAEAYLFASLPGDEERREPKRLWRVLGGELIPLIEDESISGGFWWEPEVVCVGRQDREKRCFVEGGVALEVAQGLTPLSPEVGLRWDGDARRGTLEPLAGAHAPEASCQVSDTTGLRITGGGLRWFTAEGVSEQAGGERRFSPLSPWRRLTRPEAPDGVYCAG